MQSEHKNPYAIRKEGRKLLSPTSKNCYNSVQRDVNGSQTKQTHQAAGVSLPPPLSQKLSSNDSVPVPQRIAQSTRSRKSISAFRKRKERDYDTWRGRIGINVKVQEYNLKVMEEVFDGLSDWNYVNHYDVIRVWQQPVLTEEQAMGGFTSDDSQTQLDISNLQTAATLEVFLFSFGAAVFWNFRNAKAEDDWLDKHVFCHPDVYGADYDEHAIESASDDVDFVYGDKFEVRRDVFQLETKEPNEKLAVSFGLAKSSLLSIYEWMLEKTIERNSHIPKELATTGTIQISKKEISKEIGRIFLVHHGINLDSNLQDTPEEFWEDDRFEEKYERTLLYFEIAKRHQLVNNRLAMLQDLHRVLIDEFQNKHEVWLEWIIIWLIFLEVLFEVYHAFFD